MSLIRNTIMECQVCGECWGVGWGGGLSYGVAQLWGGSVNGGARLWVGLGYGEFWLWGGSVMRGDRLWGRLSYGRDWLWMSAGRAWGCYGGARLWGGSGVGLSAMGLSCELSYGAQCYRAQLLSGLNYGTQRYGAQLWGSVMG